MSSRETVLGRIRAALTDVPDTEAHDTVAVPRAYRDSHADADLTGLFMERAADYHATVTRTHDARAAVTAAFERHALTRVIVPAGFPEEWLPSAGTWQRLCDDPPLGVQELDTASGVVTTCALAIAVTGTLVLDAGPGQGRRAITLLPDYHLCLVRADQIAGDVPEALPRIDPRRPLTLVSGPSATSDIELQRVEGVHGPRTLDIVIVEPEGQDMVIAAPAPQ
ncbi:lactate utilization protein C [Streptomyces inhibens]|uniref:LutC/YkgG family protein n=1 Tax=Streptomyces inhibens TaxID=2293571 RepID=UPI0036CB581A